jgi:aspartyl/asparaginyl beta-hydroxylase (cupin superfamily)
VVERSLAARTILGVARLILKGRQRLYYRAAGGEGRPVFHDVDAVCPELKRIDQNFEVIRSELQNVLPERHRLPRYHEADARQTEISNTGKDWRVFFLVVKYPDVPLSNAALCPKTVEILRGIPGIVDAFFSILEPGKSVPAHEGPSYCHLRYHAAFQVPRENPPSIRIKDQHYTWKEGESILFDDSWEHEVYNQSDDVRVVLIVDVLRPVSWYARAVGSIGLGLAMLGNRNTDWTEVDERLRLRHA